MNIFRDDKFKTQQAGTGQTDAGQASLQSAKSYNIFRDPQYIERQFKPEPVYTPWSAPQKAPTIQPAPSDDIIKQLERQFTASVMPGSIPVPGVPASSVPGAPQAKGPVPSPTPALDLMRAATQPPQPSQLPVRQIPDVQPVKPPVPVDTVTGAAPQVTLPKITPVDTARKLPDPAAPWQSRLPQPTGPVSQQDVAKQISALGEGFEYMGRGIVRGLSVGTPQTTSDPLHAWAYEEPQNAADKANLFVGEILGSLPFYIMGGQLLGAAVKSFGPAAKLGLSARAIQQEAARQAMPTADSALGRIFQRGLQSAGELAPRLGAIASAKQAATEAALPQDGAAERIGKATTEGMAAGAILGFTFGAIAQAYPEAKFKIQTMRAGRKVALPKDAPQSFGYNEVQAEIDRLVKEGWKYDSKRGVFTHPNNPADVTTIYVNYKGKEMRLTDVLRDFGGKVPGEATVASTIKPTPAGTVKPAPVAGMEPAAASAAPKTVPGKVVPGVADVKPGVVQPGVVQAMPGGVPAPVPPVAPAPAAPPAAVSPAASTPGVASADTTNLWQQGYDAEYYGQKHDFALIDDPNYQAGIQEAKETVLRGRDNFKKLMNPLWRVYFSQKEPPTDAEGAPVDFAEYVTNAILDNAKNKAALPQGIHITTKGKAQQIADKTGHAVVFVNPQDEKGIPFSEYTKNKYAIELPWVIDKQKGINSGTAKGVILDKLRIGDDVFVPKEYSGIAVEEQPYHATPPPPPAAPSPPTPAPVDTARVEAGREVAEKVEAYDTILSKYKGRKAESMTREEHIERLEASMAKWRAKGLDKDLPGEYADYMQTLQDMKDGKPLPKWKNVAEDLIRGAGSLIPEQNRGKGDKILPVKGKADLTPEGQQMADFIRKTTDDALKAATSKPEPWEVQPPTPAAEQPKAGAVEKPEVERAGVKQPEVKPGAASTEKPSITKAQEARTEKTLERRTDFGGDFGVMTRREFVEKIKEMGMEIKAIQVRDETATKKAENRVDYLRKNAPLGNENHPLSKEYKELQAKLKEGIKKTEYRAVMDDGTFYDVTKTEYEYFKGLEKKPAVEKPETKPPEAEKIKRYNELVENIAKENPLNKLKRGNISVASTAGKTSPPLSAYKVSDSLYVHKEYDHKTQKPSRKQDAPWMITAHPAGMALGKYKTPEEAIATAVAFDRSGLEIGKTISVIKKQANLLAKIREDFRAGIMPEEAAEGKVKPLSQKETELDKRIEQAHQRADERGWIRLSKGPRPTKEEPPDYTFKDTEVEERFQAAHGLQSPNKWQEIQDIFTSLFNKFTRTHEQLPNTGYYMPLRNALIQLGKQRDVAAAKTARRLKGILVDLKDEPELFNVFERKVILDDLMEDVKRYHETLEEAQKEGRLDEIAPYRLPFGLTEKTLRAEHKRLTDALKSQGGVNKALKEREEFWQSLVDQYVKAQEAIGHHVEDRFKRVHYYRHQVLEYANDKLQRVTGTGTKLKTPRGRAFLKARSEAGTDLDFNTNYLEAEFEVMAQMYYDIKVAEAIKLVDDKYNIVNQLKAQAVALNDERIMPFFEKMADTMTGEAMLRYERGETKKEPEPITAEQAYRRMLHTKQAMGFDALGTLAAEGALPDQNGKYHDFINALATNHLENAAIKKKYKKDWKPEMRVELPKWARDQLFPYMNWLLNGYKQVTEAKGAAAMVFKGMAEKKEFIKKTLGRDYVTWEDIVPEGFSLWQPREGNVFYFADTLPESIATRLYAGALEEIGLNKDMIRKVLAKGQRFPEMVVKDEIAYTLDNLTKNRPGDRAAYEYMRRALTAWKQYQLISPPRLVKYNLRNLSSDIEFPIGLNLGTFKHMPRVWEELYRFFFKDGNMSKELEAWTERGGVQGTLQVQEMGDINHLRDFERMIRRHGSIKEVPGKAWETYWKTARMGTDFRDSMLRYAAFLDYVGQMRQNPNGRPTNFGASNPEEIMALDDIYDRAYWLSNELLGAYDRISEGGRWLREYLVPFWSWKEVNMRRFIRIMKNAANDEQLAETVGRLALNKVRRMVGATPTGPLPPFGNAKGLPGEPPSKIPGKIVRSAVVASRVGQILLRLSALWVAFQMYNNWVWPEEEKGLAERDRKQWHIIIGRDKKGGTIFFNRLGFMGDLFEWIGDVPWNYANDIIKNRKTPLQVAGEIARAPFGVMLTGLGPHWTYAVELPTGMKLFPDPFNPGRIRDTGYHIAQGLGMGDTYSRITKRPTQDYATSAVKTFAYRQEAGQGAYYDTLDLKRQYLKSKGKGTFVSGDMSEKSQALFNIKLAIRYEDGAALEKYVKEYAAAGGTKKGMETSLKNMHPLHGLSKEEQREFVETFLDSNERARLIMAEKFYYEVLLGHEAGGRGYPPIMDVITKIARKSLEEE